MKGVQEQITAITGCKVELCPGCAHQLKFDLVDKLCQDEVWGVSGWWVKMFIITEKIIQPGRTGLVHCAQKIVGREECAFPQSCPDCSVETSQKPRYGLRLPLCPVLC